MAVEFSDVHQILSHFSETASLIKDRAGAILQNISDGLTPRQSDVIGFNNSILTLQQAYESMKLLADQYIASEDLPKGNMPIYEYASLIEQRKNLIEEKIDAARKILRRFISVKSYIEKYQAALSPYQNEAVALLSELDQGHLENIGDDVFSRSELFLSALDCKDLASDEGSDLLDRLDAYYTSDVTYGLIRKRYYAETLEEKTSDETDQIVIAPGEERSCTEPTTDISLAEDSSQQGETAEESDEQEEVLPAEDTVPTATETASAADTEEGDNAVCEPIGTDCISDTTPISTLAQRAIANGLLVPSDFSFGELKHHEGAGKSKKISSKIFLNELSSGYLNLSKYILYSIITSGCVRFENDMLPHGIDSQKLAKMLNHLFIKGYIDRYELIPGGEFYCGTDRLFQALSFSGPAKFIGLKKPRPLRAIEEKVEDTAVSAAIRLCFLIAYRHGKAYFSRSPVRTNSFIGSYSFVLRSFYEKDPEHAIMFFGAYWPDTSECYMMHEVFGNHPDEIATTDRLCFCGVDVQHAKRLASLIIEEFHIDLPHDRLLLHSFSDQSFYTFDTLQKTEWHIPEAEKKDEQTTAESQIDDKEVPQTASVTEAEPESTAPQGAESIEESLLAQTETTTDEDIPADTDNDNDTETSVTPENTDETSCVPEENDIADNPCDIGDNTVEAPIEKWTASVANGDMAIDRLVDSKNDTLDVSHCSDTPEHYRKCYLRMLAEDKLYCATAYMKALAQRDVGYEAAYEQLAYAINDPMTNCYYSSDGIFSVYSTQGGADYPYYVVSAILRNYFSDQCVYDYSMQSLYSAMPEYLSCEPLLSKYSNLREVLYQLMLFKQDTKHGIDFYADYRQQKRMQFEDTLYKIREKAKDYYDNNVVANVRETASNRQAIETKKSLFAKESDLGISLDTVVRDARVDIEFIEDVLLSHFIKDGECIHSDHIDSKKLDKYLDDCWSEIGKTMRPKRTQPCLAPLRTNILAILRKIAEVLCQYVEIIRQSTIDEYDAGLIRYKNDREGIMTHLTCLCSQLTEPGESAEETAGRHVLAATARELLSRLDGTYVEEARTFFYYGFLQSGWILLDESGHPELDDVSEIEEMSALRRIERHAFGRLVDHETRLQNILNEEDDFGSAELLYEYLRATGKNLSEEIPDIIRQATEDIVQINGRLETKRSAFIGDIELAECYGKFDNTYGSRKESFVQIMDYWYNVVLENRNFGFFYKVTDAILEKVNRDAEIRKGSILSHLNSYKEENPDWTTKERVPLIIKEIERRIELQNYAAAEDLLNRLKANDLPEKTEFDFYDYLDNFINDSEYRANHQGAGTAGGTITFKIVDARNFDAKQAKKLLENWPTGNSTTNTERISVVLSMLGFNIESVTPGKKIQRAAANNYVVKLKQAESGNSNHYTHPIYAFGSDAKRDGFRVVNIFGRLDAEKIIGLCRDIGTTMHTLILLDCSLTLPDRRILAYMMKIEHFSKVFLVLDRVALIYLAKHYNSNNIQKMLMAITVPFSYCQPYISSSSIVMPPEIFIGRRDDLQKITDLPGANIVYGGRQLGKSALLRMAQKNISAEPQKRAILIDINRKNAVKTAEAISYALYQEGIIKKGEITDDWDTLANMISDYLRSDSISYLLLLLDEADTFIEYCMKMNSPLDALKRLQTNHPGKFKFVLAGLRNVVRLNPEIALSDNNVLPHIDHITVKPFRSYEARELLELPLSYLGFRFPKNEETDMLISNIFSETNYFPGLLQLFCTKLIEALHHNYGGFESSDSPPYIVTERIIKRVLADEYLRAEIKYKFDITLRIGDDHYYYVIALLGAYHYHNKDGQNGFSVQNIRDLAEEFNIALVKKTTDVQLRAFMEEMRELNILQRVDNTRYRFARYNFYQMIGSNRKIEEYLMEYMEG